MNPLTLIISISQTIAAALLANKGDAAKVAEYSGYLNMAAVLADLWTKGNKDLALLDEQLRHAVADGNRGLTAEQRAQWRGRDDLSTDIAAEWLEEHP